MDDLLEQARKRLDAFAEALLGPDFSERLARVPVRLGSSGVDAFGLDPEVAKYAVIVAAFFHRLWFRTEVHGIENVGLFLVPLGLAVERVERHQRLHRALEREGGLPGVDRLRVVTGALVRVGGLTSSSRRAAGSAAMAACLA